MIVVTGGDGFIGRNLIKRLRKNGHLDVVSLDTKHETVNSILSWLTANAESIDIIFHMGALTNTKEFDETKFNEFNITPSIFIWNLCAHYDIPLVYASSAATYGDGKNGFDDETDIFNLKPLNPYGESKQTMDKWVTTARFKPPNWYGLKFFNVYGYGEQDKGEMASMAYHLYHQIKETGQAKLFKSHKDGYDHGEQKRDFVYVDDVVDVCLYLMYKTPVSGIYNVGTGKARSFNDLAKAIFESLGKDVNISYIDIPYSIRLKYQYFTEAKLTKLRNLGGYKRDFHELEEGIAKYIKNLQDENC